MGAEAADDRLQWLGGVGRSEWECSCSCFERAGELGESAEYLTIENGEVTGYRVRVGVSFKYDGGD